MTGPLTPCTCITAHDRAVCVGLCERLPTGATCADCAHMPRCTWLLSRDGTETACDWAPSRFRPRERT